MQVPIATRRFVFIPMDLQDLSVGLLQVPNKQWGTNTIGSRTTRTEAYPLPYSEFCLPIVSGKGYVGGLNYGFGVGVTNFGLTSVTIANNSEDSSYRWTGYTYIVVGAQPQWGFTNNTGRPYITFPFKFSNVFTAISCICHNGSPSEANTVYNVSISGMNIGASGGGSGKYWCAFGVAQQQWGYCSSRTATFPIPFPASALFIVAVPKTTSTSATATGAEYLGTTSVNLYLHGTSGWYFVGGH